jgi:hypothetical protein
MIFRKRDCQTPTCCADCLRQARIVHKPQVPAGRRRDRRTRSPGWSGGVYGIILNEALAGRPSFALVSGVAIRRYDPGVSLRAPRRPVKWKLLAPARARSVKLPWVVTSSVHRRVCRLRRVALTQWEPLGLRPGRTRTTVKRTLASRFST